MKNSLKLVRGKLIKRYKRFLADVELESGEIVTAYCANTGTMKTCDMPGSPVVLSVSDNPKRKLKYTWELIRINGGWAGINTALPNQLAAEAIQNGTIAELQGYANIRREVKYGENSRIDLLLENGGQRCYVEVKNVTMVENNRALFPDAVTLRGQKHLRELMTMAAAGHRAVMVYVVQREDCVDFAPADEIDPRYGELLREAAKNGVEILAYQASVAVGEIVIDRPMPVVL